MKKLGLVAITTAASFAVVAFGCTHTIVQTVEDSDASAFGTSSGTTSSSGSSSGKTSSSGGSSTSSGGSSTSSGGSSTSSGGSSSGTTSSGGSSSGTTSSGGSSSGDGGGGTCPTTAPIAATSLPYKPAAPLQSGKCTAAQVTAMQSYLTMNPNATTADFENFVKTQSMGCHDCVFTDDATGTTWGPAPMNAGNLVTVNVGSCYSIVSGKEACGKAIQNAYDCSFAACQDCADQTSFQTCQKAAATGACSAESSAISTACAGAPANIDTTCGTFFQSITAQCVDGT